MRAYLISTLAAVVLGAAQAQAAPVFTAGSLALDASTSSTCLTCASIPLSSNYSPTDPTGSFTAVVLPGVLDHDTGALDFGSDPTLGWFDTGLGTFTVSGPVVNLGETGTGPFHTQSYGVGGDFLLGSDWANAGKLVPTAAETISLTQTAGGGLIEAVSLSATFAAAVVPEPRYFGLTLVGVAMLTVGWLSRRRPDPA